VIPKSSFSASTLLESSLVFFSQFIYLDLFSLLWLLELEEIIILNLRNDPLMTLFPVRNRAVWGSNTQGKILHVMLQVRVRLILLMTAALLGLL
jgi:hypothetical protein